MQNSKSVTTISSWGPFKWVPYRWHHKTGGWFDGHLYFFNIRNWCCPIGIFWALRGEDFCLNYAVVTSARKLFQ